MDIKFKNGSVLSIELSSGYLCLDLDGKWIGNAFLDVDHETGNPLSQEEFEARVAKVKESLDSGISSL